MYSADEGANCDDGNDCTTDECSGACVPKPKTSGTPCQGGAGSCGGGNCIIEPVCGDGKVGSGEGCDDSNLTTGDGCKPDCTVEIGFTCTGAPSTCTNKCQPNPCLNGGICGPLPGGFVCTCKAGFGGAECAALMLGGWKAGGGPSLGTPRTQYNAILLKDGRVALIGGLNGGITMATAALYDPATGKVVEAANTMSMSRNGMVSALLANGKVVVAFGVINGGALATNIHVFDPTTNLFDAGTAATPGRNQHTVTVLPDGRVLIAGGAGFNNASVNDAKLFTPSTLGVKSVAIGGPRHAHGAALLANGKVLLVGGRSGVTPLATGAVFDPATDSVTTVGGQLAARSNPAVTVLFDGKVLISGDGVDSADLYDPKTNQAVTISPAGGARFGHSTTQLQNGRVLLAGGTIGAASVASTSIFDPLTGKFSAGPDLPVARTNHVAALLDNGRVLLIGGNAPALTTTSVLVDLSAAGSAANTATSMNIVRGQILAVKMKNGRVFVPGGYNGQYLSTTELFE